MNLKDARKRADMTLGQAAKRIGVHERTLIRWESGLRHPVGPQIPAIQRAYNLTDAEVLSLLKKEPA